ncbi:MAG: MoaD/ThiS family protein [Sedimentibacter sp.]
MEIEIRLFASFRNGRWKSKRLLYDDNVQIMDVLDFLHINKEEIGMILVNGSYQTVDYNLHDNDILALFPPVAGG